MVVFGLGSVVSLMKAESLTYMIRFGQSHVSVVLYAIQSRSDASTLRPSPSYTNLSRYPGGGFSSFESHQRNLTVHQKQKTTFKYHVHK